MFLSFNSIECRRQE